MRCAWIIALALTACAPDEAAFRISGGSLICSDGATGYQAPGGMIFALNASGEDRARTFPTNRSWRPLSDGLAAHAQPRAIDRLRVRAEAQCRPA